MSIEALSRKSVIELNSVAEPFMADPFGLGKAFLRMSVVCPICKKRDCPHAEDHTVPCATPAPGSGIMGKGETGLA